MAVGTRLPLLRALGLALPLLTGCEPVTPSGGAPLELETRESEVRIANSLTTEALLFNSITTNPTANAIVSTGALRALFDPVTGNGYLQHQLRDVDAQHVMEYVVSCALPMRDAIDWKEPVSGGLRQWEGKAGLCPEWADAAPSEACLRRVSSCVVARNNAFGRRVELSLRGEDPKDPSKFDLEVMTRPSVYAPLTSTPLASFQPCEGEMTGVSRDCGWSPDAMGQCKPGQTVRLGAGGVPLDQCRDGKRLGTSAGRPVLRVCEGIAGCDEHDQRMLGQSESSCFSLLPAVSFTCPPSGSFNVMTGAWTSSAISSAQVAVEPGTPASAEYRISEQKAFRYREGAFYGTLFDATALAATVYVDKAGLVRGKGASVKGSVYRKMFSCYDPAWQHGNAYATHRVCTLPSEAPYNCAASVMGPCLDTETPSNSLCADGDGSAVRVGDRDYERCLDHQRNLWEEPVTVFLHGPCDMGAPGLGDICRRLNGQ
ncbi:hypothetical protein P2318_33400 [Myxococcaceae bacterium GXIMD 01537]